MEGIVVLNSNLDINTIFKTMEIDGFMENVFAFIYFSKKRNNTTFKIIMMFASIAIIIKMEVSFRGKIGMIFNRFDNNLRIEFESFLENFRIVRQGPISRPRLMTISCDRLKWLARFRSAVKGSSTVDVLGSRSNGLPSVSHWRRRC